MVIESARSFLRLNPMVVSPALPWGDCRGEVTFVILSFAPFKIGLGLCAGDDEEKNKIARVINPALHFPIYL